MAKMIKLTKAGGATSLFNADKIVEVEAHGSDPDGLLSRVKLDTLTGVQEVAVQEPYDLVEQKINDLEPQ